MPKQMLEYLLGCLLAGALVLLLLVQAGMYLGRVEPVGTWLGARYDEAQTVAAGFDETYFDEPYGVVTLELAEYSRLELARVLVNGCCVAWFDEQNVRVRVGAGDVLALDVRAYERPVRVRVKQLSSGIDGAFLLRDVEACGEVVELGRIVMP